MASQYDLIVWAWFGAAGAAILWLACLVRDLPRRSALGAAAVAALPIATGLGFGLAKASGAQISGDVYLAGIMFVILAFVLVTRGHTLRAIDPGWIDVPPEIEAKYQQAVVRHQMLGLAVGLSAGIAYGVWARAL